MVLMATNLSVLAQVNDDILIAIDYLDEQAIGIIRKGLNESSC